MEAFFFARAGFLSCPLSGAIIAGRTCKGVECMEWVETDGGAVAAGFGEDVNNCSVASASVMLQVRLGLSPGEAYRKARDGLTSGGDGWYRSLRQGTPAQVADRHLQGPCGMELYRPQYPLEPKSLALSSVERLFGPAVCCLGEGGSLQHQVAMAGGRLFDARNTSLSRGGRRIRRANTIYYFADERLKRANAWRRLRDVRLRRLPEKARVTDVTLHAGDRISSWVRLFGRDVCALNGRLHRGGASEPMRLEMRFEMCTCVRSREDFTDMLAGDLAVNMVGRSLSSQCGSVFHLERDLNACAKPMLQSVLGKVLQRPAWRRRALGELAAEPPAARPCRGHEPGPSVTAKRL